MFQPRISIRNMILKLAGACRNCVCRSYTEPFGAFRVKFKSKNPKSVSKQAGKRWCEFKPQLTGDVCCQCTHISQHYINFHPTFTLLPLEVWRYRHSGFEVYHKTKQENSPFPLPVPSFSHFVRVHQPTCPKIFFVFSPVCLTAAYL